MSLDAHNPREHGYWRSLEELAGAPELRDAKGREFPDGASEWTDGMSRRRFLKLMAASIALAGIEGCINKHPEGQIVPRTTVPEETELGRPTFFASAMPFDGYGRGVLALSYEGRPIKIEGNPDHPDSLGATDVFMQASVLDLYDPDRLRMVMYAGQSRSLGEFGAVLSDRLNALRGDGTGLRILTRPTTSPTIVWQLDEFQRQFPNAKWHAYDPVQRAADRESDAFGEPASVVYDYRKPGTILSIDNDFLMGEPGSLRYARQFSDGRRVRKDEMRMSRLWVIESAMSLSGSMADERLVVRPSQLHTVIWALARRLGVEGVGSDVQIDPATSRWLDALAQELSRSHEPTLVTTGRYQPAAMHALVHAINQKLGNVGKTVHFIPPVEKRGAGSLASLVADMNAGDVNTLLIVGGNPAYDAPADVPFAEALAKLTQARQDNRYLNFTAHLTLHDNETSRNCQWVVNQTHWLESWGDVRAFDGTASIIQPLIHPLYGGLSEWQLMDRVLGQMDRPQVAVVQAYWRKQVRGDFDAWWVKSLQKGIVEGSAFEYRAATNLRRGDACVAARENSRLPRDRRGETTARQASPLQTEGEKRIEVFFRPDPSVWAGEFANNAWLRELPKPFTKQVWDNAALVNVQTAKTLGNLHDGDTVRISAAGRTLDAPILILPGLADGVALLHLGYGRRVGGRIALDDQGHYHGYDAYRIRTSDSPWQSPAATIAPLGGYELLVTTRNHHAMEVHPDVPGIEPWLKPHVIARPGMSESFLALANRKLVRTASLSQFREHPDFVEDLAPDEKKPLLSLYPDWKILKDWKLQWGMVIDQTACIGCNACVIACQAENNIPVVGKTEISRQREMHWIRIDDYFSGPVENPIVFHQPVPCMHCENAPCEVVCPVGATTHSAEGINEMTYNRCIGTRFCSNNCPYKVRRFNFLLYSDFTNDSRSLQYNPEVTVRSRGVMEKCTYCIQRIDLTRMEMEREGMELRELAAQSNSDDERQKLLKLADQREREVVRTLQTACQQACPTRAIIFGNLQDPGSDVTKLKHEPHNYELLKSLTTKPRTSYLARITNPSAELAAGGRDES
jgi:molybdopterin-containing oxidoreductase family iron-sulfur binding subunit